MAFKEKFTQAVRKGRGPVAVLLACMVSGGFAAYAEHQHDVNHKGSDTTGYGDTGSIGQLMQDLDSDTAALQKDNQLLDDGIRNNQASTSEIRKDDALIERTVYDESRMIFAANSLVAAMTLSDESYAVFNGELLQDESLEALFLNDVHHDAKFTNDRLRIYQAPQPPSSYTHPDGLFIVIDASSNRL